MSQSTPQSRRWVIVHTSGRPDPDVAAGHDGTHDAVSEGDPLAVAWNRAECLAPPERIITVTTLGRLAGQPSDQLTAPGPLLEQPLDFGEGLGVLLGLSYVRSIDPDATVLLVPAGSRATPEGLFVEHIGRAAELAERRGDRIVLLGAIPGRIDATREWIETTPSATPGAAASAAVGLRTIHRPGNGDEAEHYYDGFLWNTHVAAAPARLLWEVFLQAMPETTARFDALARVLHAIACLRAPDGHGQVALDHVYSRVEPWRLGEALPPVTAEQALVVPLEGVRWPVDEGAGQADFESGFLVRVAS